MIMQTKNKALKCETHLEEKTEEDELLTKLAAFISRIMSNFSYTSK